MPSEIYKLGLIYAPTISVFYTILTGFISAYGITRESHEENLRGLG